MKKIPCLRQRLILEAINSPFFYSSLERGRVPRKTCGGRTPILTLVSASPWLGMLQSTLIIRENNLCALLRVCPLVLSRAYRVRERTEETIAKLSPVYLTTRDLGELSELAVYLCSLRLIRVVAQGIQDTMDTSFNIPMAPMQTLHKLLQGSEPTGGELKSLETLTLTTRGGSGAIARVREALCSLTRCLELAPVLMTCVR